MAAKSLRTKRLEKELDESLAWDEMLEWARGHLKEMPDEQRKALHQVLTETYYGVI